MPAQRSSTAPGASTAGGPAAAPDSHSAAEARTDLVRGDGISHSYGERRVLTDVSLVVPPGERIGLIGENGSGKSTLPQVLAGVLTPDAGVVQRPERTGLLWQQLPFTAGATIEQVLADAIAPARELEARLDAAATLIADHPDDEARQTAYQEVLEAATSADVWSAAARRDQTVAGLGLGSVPRDRTVRQVSGGQRSRLALAWLLVRRPEALLLDEPTNHLDDEGAAYLREVLGEWRGPVLFASHDRAFLDEVATSLVDLDPAPRPHAATSALAGSGDGPGSGHGTTVYGGGFSSYLAARRDARARWEQQYADEQAELARLDELAEKAASFGRPDRQKSEARITKKFYSDRNAKVVSQRLREAGRKHDELAAVQVRKPPAELRFALEHLRGRGAAGGVLAALSGAGVAGRLAPVDLALSAGERLLVTGGNGAGKSTLLHLIAGDLRPTTGTVNATTSVGLLAQEVRLGDPSRPVHLVYRDVVGAERAEQVPLRGLGLLHPRDLQRPAGDLSVGQQRRLALAVVLADPPDLLLLDEPTNHLSLGLVTALEAAVETYPGAVVLATHDRWARKAWRHRHLHLDPVAT